MPGFPSTFGQKQPKRILSAFLKKRTIPHALLFCGINGVGKEAAALEFAKACNCMGEEFDRPEDSQVGRSDSPRFSAPPALLPNPCGDCRSCRKIESNHHPDVIRIAPEGSFIKIARIRNLCHTLAMRPYEAKWRVVILSGARALNPSAGNALLKVLEEPPDRTVIILTAEQVSDLLPTIVSRCQQIRFRPIPLAELATFLREKHGIPAEQAPILATMANGSYTAALSMVESHWFARRTWLLEEMAALPTRPLPMILALAEKMSRNRDHLSEFLEIIQSWMRDLMVFKYTPEKIIHKDLTDTIRYASQGTDVAAIIEKTRALRAVQERIRTPANLRLATESMLLELRNIHEENRWHSFQTGR